MTHYLDPRLRRGCLSSTRHPRVTNFQRDMPLISKDIFDACSCSLPGIAGPRGGDLRQSISIYWHQTIGEPAVKQTKTAPPLIIIVHGVEEWLQWRGSNSKRKFERTSTSWRTTKNHELCIRVSSDVLVHFHCPSCSNWRRSKVHATLHHHLHPQSTWIFPCSARIFFSRFHRIDCFQKHFTSFLDLASHRRAGSYPF